MHAGFKYDDLIPVKLTCRMLSNNLKIYIGQAFQPCDSSCSYILPQITRCLNLHMRTPVHSNIPSHIMPRVPVPAPVAPPAAAVGGRQAGTSVRCNTPVLPSAWKSGPVWYFAYFWWDQDQEQFINIPDHPNTGLDRFRLVFVGLDWFLDQSWLKLVKTGLRPVFFHFWHG